jgi:hypothetical protein
MAYAPQTPYMVSPLPPDVYQGAMAAQLGEQPRAEYRVIVTWKTILGGIVCLVISLGLFATTAAAASDPSGAAGMAVLGILGLLLLAVGVYCLLFGVIYKNWHVYVYERGFIYKKGNPAAQPFRWDQIEAVWYQVTRRYTNGIYTGTSHKYRVRRQDGYEIVLNDRFTKVATLGDLVHNQVTAAKMPQVIAAYNAGQTITFGPLSVNTQGIWNSSGNLLPWPEIKDVSMQSGYVAVSKAGKWLRWSSQPVRDIPNIFLFIALVRSILKK